MFNVPKAEELSRILSWLVAGILGGWGWSGTDLLLNLLQPEVLAAILAAINIVWRVLRPPVVEG